MCVYIYIYAIKKGHIPALKVLWLLSEFGGSWKHLNNQHVLKVSEFGGSWKHTHKNSACTESVRVWWIMETPKKPACTKIARVFKVCLNLDTIQKMKAVNPEGVSLQGHQMRKHNWSC